MTTSNFQELGAAGLFLISRDKFEDVRGVFSKLFSSKRMAQAGWDKPVAQVNFSHTAKSGTVRGMHYQNAPYQEMKLVSCTRGEVYDVAVDLRAGSSTFLKWFAQTLSPKNGHSLLIPEGMAHGFQALSDDAELIYCHSAPWVKESEGGLHPLDPMLSVTWPLTVSLMSTKDSAFAHINQNFRGIRL